MISNNESIVIWSVGGVVKSRRSVQLEKVWSATRGAIC